MKKSKVIPDISQKRSANSRIRIIAINANSRGFGFAVMEGADYLIDWGVVELHQKYSIHNSLHRLRKIIDRYIPSVLVIEDLSADNEDRPRTNSFLKEVSHLAIERRIRIEALAKTNLRQSLNARTNYDIAQNVASIHPVLVPRLPPKRQLFQSEDYRMSFFQAIAFGLLFYLSSTK